MPSQGTVKSYNAAKGYGFIEVQGSQDVFFMKSENKDFADKGDQVAFQLSTGNKGPQAKEVQVVARGDGSSFGIVKSYNPTKGFGFIESEQTFAVYQKDVFFMKSALGGIDLSSGAKVTFQVQESEKGPQAANVKVVGGMSQAGSYGGGGGGGGGAGGVSPAALGALAQVPGIEAIVGLLAQALSGGAMPSAAPSAPSSYGGGYSQGGGYGKASGKGKMQAAPSMQRPAVSSMVGGGGASGSQGDNKILFGTVKSYNAGKGWGFITTNMGEDVFVLSKSVIAGTLTTGGLVVFTKSMGPKGFQADNVQTVAPQELARSYVGTVKGFQAEKGWGFIGAPEAAKFGDIFLHNRDLNGQMVSQGETVEFTIEVNNNGRPQARNVSAGGGWGGAGAYMGATPY